MPQRYRGGPAAGGPRPLQYLRPQGYQPTQASKWQRHGERPLRTPAQGGASSGKGFVASCNEDSDAPVK